MISLNHWHFLSHLIPSSHYLKVVSSQNSVTISYFVKGTNSTHSASFQKKSSAKPGPTSPTKCSKCPQTWRFYVRIFTAQLTMVLPYHGHCQGVRVVVLSGWPKLRKKTMILGGGSLQKCVRRRPFLPYLWKWKMGPSNHSYLSMIMVEIVSLPTARLGVIQIFFCRKMPWNRHPKCTHLLRRKTSYKQYLFASAKISYQTFS